MVAMLIVFRSLPADCLIRWGGYFEGAAFSVQSSGGAVAMNMKKRRSFLKAEH
jgi:hypothetical protein